MLGILRRILGFRLMLLLILITVIPSVQYPTQSSSPFDLSPSQFSSGQFKFVTYVPTNEEEYREMTKNIKCEDSDHFPTFALHYEKKKTILGCFPKINVTGNKCLEFNIKQLNKTLNKTFLQQKLNAPCGNFQIKPCNFKYSSLESYKIWECFLIYGGIRIPSLLEQQKKIDFLEERYQNMTQAREQENEESRKNITNLMEQREKLNQKINEKNSEIENLQQEILILTICCGIFGGFLFICTCIIVILTIKLLNTCRKRNETKKGGKSYTDSNNTHDTTKESDPLSDDIDTEGHREENVATEQISLTTMNDVTPESPDNDVSNQDPNGAALCDSSFSTQLNNTATERLDRNRNNQLHPMDTFHVEIENESSAIQMQENNCNKHDCTLVQIGLFL